MTNPGISGKPAADCQNFQVCEDLNPGQEAFVGGQPWKNYCADPGKYAPKERAMREEMRNKFKGGTQVAYGHQSSQRRNQKTDWWQPRDRS